MERIIESIRNLVVMVLVMELVIQLAPAKQYEPYMKILMGLIVVLRLTMGIWGWIDILEEGNKIIEKGNRISAEIIKKVEEDVTTEEWKVQTKDNKTDEIRIESIGEVYIENIDSIKSVGGMP